MGELAVELAPSLGYGLVPWQRQFLLDMGAVGPDGKWVHPRVGESVPRQQGKSVDLIVWAAVLAALCGYKVLWTEHNYSTTMEMLERFRAIFGKHPGDRVLGLPGWRDRLEAVSSQTGQEWMRFTSGGVIQFSTRTKSSRLGFSFDVVVYDEAQELTNVHTQVINPTTVSGAKHNLQIIYAGTPTRAGSAAETFRNVREQAWEGGDRASDLLWLEYGVEEPGDIWDESRWPAVMPSFGYHADVRAIRAGMKDMDELAAAQEYLGYWLPAVSQVEAPLLSEGEWAACLVEEAPAPVDGERVSYGVKFSPDGSTVALACAARPEPGSKTHIELALCREASEGIEDIADWLAVRSTNACSVAVDGRSGAGALCEALERRRVPRGYAIRPTTDQAVAAASLILDAVRNGGMTHIGDPALDLSATTSPRRKIGSQGGWGWGGENSAPIEACGLALLAMNVSRRDPSRKQVVW